jgi:hypothetical protein
MPVSGPGRWIEWPILAGGGSAEGQDNDDKAAGETPQQP